MERDSSNPTLGALLTPEKMELDEARKLLVECAIATLKGNDKLAATISQSDRDKIKASIMAADLPTLYRRIGAVQVQNPRVLVAALQACNYRIEHGPQGIGIDANVDDIGGGAGRTIDYQKFMKSLEQGSAS